MAQTGGERSDGGVYGSAVAAAGWQRGAAGRADLRPITDRMLDLAGIRPGHRVLDVAAGTGEQTLMAARRVGPDGFVLATDIADRMLAYLDEAARNEGLTKRAVDCSQRDSFDAAICRLALMLIPERHKARADALGGCPFARTRTSRPQRQRRNLTSASHWQSLGVT